ncbi:probable assembly chaperone of rpl4 isoform X2 [Polypterus senegalus]|uniref:probable assembly chaperone of rpl4 isoform X2 n=1 Tax=Polypterus senegalus TaxID=55291 RepID=UPI0019653079|nr:probable assembly chaperone of rpl4 isoform X2 [Polypterus senegalus]
MENQAKHKGKKKSKRGESQSNDDMIGFSGQERMKLRVQKKAKEKKNTKKYTVEDLLEKVEENMDNFNFEMAQIFCQQALDMEPTNVRILDMLGNIYAELGDTEKAKQIFVQSVELSPEDGYSKYMYLGQIHGGTEAVQYFTKGIDVMLNMFEKQTKQTTSAAAVSSDECEVTQKDIAAAFCSIAEIYFTDLCMEDGASDKCKEAIEKALQHDPDNPEALQLMASYLFSTEKSKEGKDFLMKGIAAWLPSLQKRPDDLPCENKDEEEQQDILQVCPPYESRVTTAKLLIEAEDYELYTKLKCDDPQLMEHTEQLLTELGPQAQVQGVEQGKSDLEQSVGERSEDEPMEE